MKLRTGKSNQRHEKIVRALAIAHNVNNFHQAADADRVPRTMAVGATVAAAMPRRAIGEAAGGRDSGRRAIGRCGAVPMPYLHGRPNQIEKS